MAEPIYNLRFEIKRTDPPTIYPTDVKRAGYSGDHRAVQLTFAVANAIDGHRYRIEIVDGNGAYDITELLDAADGVISYDIPSSWTAAGIASVRLVEIEISEDGAEKEVAHYPDAKLLFEARDDGPKVLPRWQAVMTKVESVISDVETKLANGEFKGEKGDKGDKGDKGNRGDPGDNYVLKETDKTEIANMVLAALPNGDEVAY